MLRRYMHAGINCEQPLTPTRKSNKVFGNRCPLCYIAYMFYNADVIVLPLLQMLGDDHLHAQQRPARHLEQFPAAVLVQAVLGQMSQHAAKARQI